MFHHPYRQGCLFILQLITVTSKMTQLMGRTSSTELHRLCTSNQVLMLSPKSYKSIATKIDLSIMIHFQLVKFVQSQNQKMKSTLSLTPKNKDTDLHRKWGCIWFLTKTLKRENSTNVTTTWAAYNSLITKVLPVTIHCGLPLYPAPPTDWSNFYTALKLCQNISTATYPGGKTIISLDLQLYSKAIQLQSRDEINRNFVFRPSKLHMVFAFLHAMGKYIQDSGIDQTFIEAGLYRPATLNQILTGKHIKRGMEAHMVIYLCLHKIYLKKLFTKCPEQEDKLQCLISVYLLEFESKDFSNF